MCVLYAILLIIQDITIDELDVFTIDDARLFDDPHISRLQRRVRCPSSIHLVPPIYCLGLSSRLFLIDSPSLQRDVMMTPPSRLRCITLARRTLPSLPGRGGASRTRPAMRPL